MKIGVIGLGIMGKPMAKNLLKAGYDVCFYARREDVIEEMKTLGAEYMSAEEVGAASDILLTMLPDGPDVKKVLLGEDGEEGVAAHMKAGSAVIDASSVNPKYSIDIARALAERGIGMLDAPVSGGEEKAIDGTLTFMVGGDPELFERCKPILLAMGASATLCGPVGAGNTTKLVNQIIASCSVQALSEAFQFAINAGVDPEVVMQAIQGGMAGSLMMKVKVPKMIAGDFRPGFKIDLNVKDLNNVVAYAEEIGASVPMTESAREVLKWVQEDGHGGDDHSAMITWYRR